MKNFLPRRSLAGALSLANSTLSCAVKPSLYAPLALAFNVSGTSQITGDGWQGNMGSATTLDIASGGTFRIKNCGVLNTVIANETLNFSTDANHAILNNSSLILDASNLRWGSNVGTGSEMTLTNNSTLQLVGQSKLRTHDITLQNSSISMDNNTRIDVIYNTELDNSTATPPSSPSLLPSLAWPNLSTRHSMEGASRSASSRRTRREKGQSQSRLPA